MNMIPVSSSNLAMVGYKHGTLRVQFRNGGLYDYSGVPEQVYRSLMSAPSKGRFLHRHIKGAYPCMKLR